MIFSRFLFFGSYTLGVSAAPPTPPGAYGLYVEGSAPGSGEIQGLNGAGTDLPGFNHLLQNQSSPVNRKPKSSEKSVTDIELDGVCKHVTLGGHGRVGETSLDAKCVDKHGQWWDTSLNLNDCAANDEGRLVYHDGGNFDDSCRPCAVNDPAEEEGLKLKCNCINGDGLPQYTYLPLGSHVDEPLAVRAVDGRLVCGKRLGSKSPSF